jgi:hypothetical protein
MAQSESGHFAFHLLLQIGFPVLSTSSELSPLSQALLRQVCLQHRDFDTHRDKCVMVVPKIFAYLLHHTTMPMSF